MIMNAIRIILLCCFAMLAVVGGHAYAQDIGGYTKEVVVSLPWGTEPGEIGEAVAVTGDFPLFQISQAVDDKGTIYLLDSGNSRIQVFDRYGKFQRMFSLIQRPYDCDGYIVYDNGADMLYEYDRNANKFNVYSSEGIFVRTIYYTSPFSITHLRIEDGVVYNDNLTGRFTDRDYSIEHTDSGVLLTVTESEALIHSINLSTLFPEFADNAYTFIGETNRTDVLIGCFFPPISDVSPYKVFKFDKDFNLRSRIIDPDFRKRPVYRINSHMDITDNGEIYTITVNRDGVKVLKWVME